MTRRSALVALVVAVAVLAATATPLGVVAAHPAGPAPFRGAEQSSATVQATEQSNAVLREGDAPNGTAGQRLAAAVGRQRGATTGRIRVRAYEQAYDGARSDAERARVSARYLRAGERHLAALEARRAALRDRREAGELSAGSHRALAARLWTEADALATLAATIRNRTADLPGDLRREHDVTASDVSALGDAARELRATTPAPGAGPDPSVYDDVEAFASSLEERAGGGAVSDRLDGERVTFLVDTADGRVAVSFTVTGDGRVTGLAAGAHEDPTLRVVTDRETLGALADADDPGRRLGTAVRDGSVQLRGVGPVKRVEWGIVELAAEYG